LTKVAYATEENIRLSAIWQTWLKLDEGQGQFNRTGPVGPKIFLKIFNFHGILFCIYVDKFLVSAYWTSHPSKIPHPQKLKSFPLYFWQFLWWSFHHNKQWNGRIWQYTSLYLFTKFIQSQNHWHCHEITNLVTANLWCSGS